jgi:hypothetical protein
MIRHARLALIAAFLVLLSGCTALPPYEETRSAARDEMQAFVDTIPKDQIVRIEDEPEGDSYPCEGGAAYTGQWTVYTERGFDIADWIRRTARAWTEKGYTPYDDGVERTVATSSFFSPDGIYLVADENSEGASAAEPYIILMAFGNCGAITDEE